MCYILWKKIYEKLPKTIKQNDYSERHVEIYAENRFFCEKYAYLWKQLVLNMQPDCYHYVLTYAAGNVLEKQLAFMSDILVE